LLWLIFSWQKNSTIQPPSAAIRATTPSDTKEKVCDEFVTYNRIRELCSNSSLPITFSWKHETPSQFTKATKDLFEFLYTDTFNTASFKAFCGQSLKDHYQKYREQYELSMCPFCGLDDYVDMHADLDWRDAYDHYLHKSLYPFAAVNPENLFPMCTACNSKAKGASNVLFQPDTGQRHQAAYPADETFEIEVRINDAFTNPAATSIFLTGNPKPETQERFNTWLSVFKIQARYEGRINIKKKDWLAFVIRKSELEADKLTTELQERLSEQKKALKIRKQREIHLEISFLQFCIDHIHALISFFRNDPNYAQYLKNRIATLST
jgi:hypothetical protein